jgi:hypothetical protein
MRTPTPAKPPYTARPGEAIRVTREAEGDFAIGVGRLRIAGDDQGHVEDVVADLHRLALRPAGQKVLEEGDTIGRQVRIERPEPPTEPPNAWVAPEDVAAAAAAGTALGRGPDGSPRFGTGAGCGSTIVYDPADWPFPGDSTSPSSVDVLLLLLRQANLNARGASDPGKPDWGAEAGEQEAAGAEPVDLDATLHLPPGPLAPR